MSVAVAKYGEDHANAKLTDEEARVIYSRLANGEKGVKLAREFRVSTNAICRIGQGKTYAKATKDLRENRRVGV